MYWRWVNARSEKELEPSDPLSIISVPFTSFIPLQSFEMARFHTQSIPTLYVVLIIFLPLTLYIIRICLSLIEINNSL